jgi:hypothetical protein
MEIQSMIIYKFINYDNYLKYVVLYCGVYQMYSHVYFNVTVLVIAQLY